MNAKILYSDLITDAFL